jgi:hypothetical protein
MRMTPQQGHYQVTAHAYAEMDLSSPQLMPFDHHH